MTIADHGMDAGQRGDLLRRALRVTSGDQDARGGIFPVHLRRKARAVRSACAVTLQVLATITSAWPGFQAGVRPRWRKSALMISPSARLARHPKFSTWYSATLPV